MKNTNRLLLAAFLLLVSAGCFAQQFNTLVFTKTAGWHHDSINAGVTAIQEIGKLHNFDVFWTEDAERVFNDEELRKYQAVIFLLTTGDVLNSAQQAAFERYIRRGGGYVGVHSASDTEYDWKWYTMLVGRMFRMHPEIQTATVKVEERNFPGMDRFGERFLFTEEWYEFDAERTDKLHYLLTVDEQTYRPATSKGAGMGAFHPVSWHQTYDGGRSFYTALGHLSATYGDQNFRHHLYGGIYWAATGKGFRAQ